MGLQSDAIFSLGDLGSGVGSVEDGDDGGEPDISVSSGCPAWSPGSSLLIVVDMFCGEYSFSSTISESE